MASSSQHPGRPRLGAVLSRKQWEDRRSNSTTSSITSHASNRDSTGPSFDPENEAIVSTGPINPAPSMKNSRKAVDGNAWEFDMKASKAAFSDGSDSGSDLADLSVEIGRGGRHANIGLDDSRNNDSIHSSNAMIGDYRVMYSPPLSTNRRSMKANTNDHARNLRQDAQIRLASMASQKENQDPAPPPFKSLKPSDLSSKVKRQTLGEIHARASDTYDGSLLNDDRPTQVAPSTKTTRFSRSKRNSSNHELVNGTNTTTEMVDTKQSYILPELPNLSQMVSATMQDKTPGRIRSSAHPALSHTPRDALHKPIDTVPIPEDEKEIFVSLNLLRGKVNDLEAGTMQFQQTIEELKTKNLLLKAEKRELKLENERLRKQNAELRSRYGSNQQPDPVDQPHRHQVSPQKQRKANVLAQVNSQVLQILQDRQEEDLFSLTPTESMKLRPSSFPPQRNHAAGQANAVLLGSKVQHEINVSNRRQNKKVVIEETTTRNGHNHGRNSGREQTSTQNMTHLTTQPPPHHLSDLRHTLETERVDTKKRHSHGAASQKAAIGATRQLLDTSTSSTAAQQQPPPRKSSMKDLTERAHTSEVTTRAEKTDTVHATYHQDLSEDITDQLSRPIPPHPARRNSDPTATATAGSNTCRRRRRTTAFDDESIMTSAFIIPDITIAQQQQQPPPTQAPTTAAAATITIAEAAAPAPHLTASAQHLIHTLNPHSASNCIICSRLTTTTTTTAHPKKTISIPPPVPVSCTPIPATAENPDPTIRPAQPPGVALAIVLKELGDQHEHLKARLAAAQEGYLGMDPRVSRGMRERRGREVERCRRRCDRVADMIYRLYDVVEGGELGGWGMGGGEVEVEVTVEGLREVVGRGMGGEWEGSEGEGEESE